MKKYLTESEAWKMIGDAFAVKRRVNDYGMSLKSLGADGLCFAVSVLVTHKLIGKTVRGKLTATINYERDYSWYSFTYLLPKPNHPNGKMLRAFFCYFMAEATKKDK